jgi:zinc transport system permease protein
MFLDAVIQFPFMQYALIAGLLASIACGVVGSFVVVRRISYIAGGIAHSVLGGMGVARYLQVVRGWDWCSPMLGAIIAALVAAFIIGFVSFRGKQREDTVIGAIWAIGMAVGILFISQTPGYGEDLMGYLFGNILMVGRSDLFVIAALDAIVLAVVIIFYKRMVAVCFDEEFARVRGLNVEFYYLLLLCLTALTVVLLVSVVGIIMVIALVTLPAAIAGRFTNSLWGMMIVAVLLSSVFTTLGLALSFGPNLPAGATIIVIAGIAYVLFAIFCGRGCVLKSK